MVNYKLHQYLLPKCENIENAVCGSYWCKAKCKHCSNYEDDDDGFGGLQHIFFTCTFNIRKEKLKKINNYGKLDTQRNDK